ncbi:MAG: acyl-ACP--UDP-N-acetylglucosamine O-acyltransferase [bacterium]|nr:acyl-ACP--UDP-N-acetylglucosamine O-acyltransferase [bacterium]
MNIHKTAIVHPKAQIEENVTIGPYCIVGEHVIIHSGTILEAQVFLDGWTEIGRDCHIFPFATLGTVPQDLKFQGEKSELKIGQGTVIREGVTAHRGTSGGGGITTIGDGCLLMAYAHVAHDCHVGNHVILANGIAMAGHVTIEDHASVGGLTAIHQFTRIGRYAYVGGASAVSKDVPPYGMAAGNRTKLYGVNSIGLQRKGFSQEAIENIKKAYRLLLSSHLNVSQAIARIEAEIDSPEVRYLVDFIKNSDRGICK